VRVDNVAIKIYRHGELEEVRTSHNVWILKGREWLAKVGGYTSCGPDTPEVKTRIRYMGVGIGGNEQGLLSVANSPPISTGYPGTNTQSDEYPLNPVFTKLERQVQITSGVWLIDDPDLFFTHLSPTECTVHGIVDGGAGDVIFGSYTQMPLSEAGLYLSDASKSSGTNDVVAYLSFDTILLKANVKLEFVWSVRF
jgi:hypothetical protein